MKRKCHFPIFFILMLLLLLGCSGKKTSKKTDGNYDRLVAKALDYFGDQQLQRAFYYFNKASNETGISADQRVYALINMAEIQRQFSDFSGSETTLTGALPYLGETQLDYSISAYNLLGIVFKEQSDFKNALKYYRLSFEKTTDILQRSVIKNNMAVVYMDEKRFDKSVQILKPLINNPKVISDVETQARIFDNLGYSYCKIGKQNEGIGFLNQSLQSRLKIDDQFGLVSTYLHLSEVWKLQNPALSERYTKSAYETATKLNSADDRLNAIAQMIEIGGGEKVKQYAMLHIRLNDSIVNVRQSAKNQFAKIRYDDAKAKQENAEVKNMNLLLVILVLSLAMIAIFIGINWKARHKREKQEQIHKTEKAMSKKIHDVLANDLYNVMTYAKANRLETEGKKETLMRHLNSIYLATRDIAHQTGDIETGKAYLPTLTEMMQLYNDHETRITVKGLQEVPWEEVSPNSKRTIYRLIQELLVNMKKHSNASLVLFDCDVSDKKLVIGYKDNGVDFQSEKDVLRKVLQNVENHIQGINGQVIFDDVSGRVNIAIPVK